MVNTKAVPVKNLGHASFQMKNEQAMLHFYRDILGMKEAFTLTLRPALEKLSQVSDQSDLSDKDREKYKWMQAVADRPWLTYLKMSDGQFIELFYDLRENMKSIEDRRAVYGYTKLNFEVDDVLAMKGYLLSEGVVLKDDYHPTLDGAFEIAVLDPDGNEVQFTQYGEHAKLTLADDPDHTVISRVKYITQVAFDVQDAVSMPAFYGQGLGLKKAMTLTVGDLARAMERSGLADPALAAAMKAYHEKPWIEYYEVGPHQYIELFYSPGGAPLREARDLQDTYGYQHICIEVSDVHKAWDAVTANGIIPDTGITRGQAGAYQFWVKDPDGNRLELMEYADGALQLL